MGIRETKWLAPHLKFVSCVAKGMGTKLVKHQKSKRSDVNIEFEIWSKTQFEVKFKKFIILRFHIRDLRLDYF